MKRITLIITAFVCLLTTAVVCHAGDTPIPAAKLPAAALAFVQKNFPDNAIVYAEKDTEFLKTTYEVRFADGTKLKFDKNGEWDKVDCQMTAVPAAIVPSAIQQYVNTTFADALVVKIDKESYGYNVELSNDIDLKFSHNEKLIGYDY